MASSPLISIITVTYNASEFIESTIKSVKDQTFTDREYVIVDGLSKDNTVDIIKKYPETVTTWISEKDRGLYDAMNKAIELAKGRYLMFLNAGDLFFGDGVLEEIFESFKDEDVIYGDTAVIDKNYKFVGMRHLSPPEKLSYKSFQRGMVVCHQAILAKKEITPFYDLRYKVAADIDWAIRLTKKMESSLFYRKPLINFMQDGISTQHRSLGLKERFKVMTRHYGLAKTLWNNFTLGLKYVFTLRFLNNVRKD